MEIGGLNVSTSRGDSSGLVHVDETGAHVGLTVRNHFTGMSGAVCSPPKVPVP